MEISSVLLIICLIYTCLLFLDRFFKSCISYRYMEFLEGTGLEIKIFRIIWSTKTFNRVIILLGSLNFKFVRLWFNLGIVSNLILLPISIYLLLLAFLDNFNPNLSQKKESIIQPIIPGINLPASELGYFSMTLLFSSIFHEMGHAIAAVQENVTVLNVGANLIFILPVAYVNLNSEKLFSLNPLNRLRILCGGVWHNIVIAFIAYLMYTSLPLCLSLFYNINIGVLITNTYPENNVLFNERGLQKFDTIVRINDCIITNQDSWYECLSKLNTKNQGLCIDADMVYTHNEKNHLKQFDNGTVTCCHGVNKENLCFEYLNNKETIQKISTFVCLPGRTIIESSNNFCSEQSFKCPGESYCFRPMLINNTSLFKILRYNDKNVIYLGLNSDLALISVSSYNPKFYYLSHYIPDFITKVLRYFIVFSMGLAIINVLPCFSTDGYYIIDTLLHYIFAKKLRSSHINVISVLITMLCTLILLIHCIIVFFFHIQNK